MSTISERIHDLFGSDSDVDESVVQEEEHDLDESVLQEQEHDVDEIFRSVFGSSSDDDEEELFSNYDHTQEIPDFEYDPSSQEPASQDSTNLRAGYVFTSINTLFEAYQEHARLKGFSVIKRTENAKYARFICDRAGMSKAQKCSKKVDCKARLNAKKLEDGSCVVMSMVSDHSHEIDPTYSSLMPAHRQLTVNMKRQLEANDIAGLRPCKNVRLCEVQSGGPDHLGCLPKDCRNYIEVRRRLRLGEGDAEAIRSMFARLQVKDPKFFYLMDINEDGRLCNVLWIHPRSRAAYAEFHDVISFDTTYLVNRYKMPFASIVGVNHHGHSILLGCALVTHEDAESFKWLFRNWLVGMDGIYPNAIITDQDASIKKAIREVMPQTIHRYCIWHIMSKIRSKFGGMEDYNECSIEFKNIVYDSLSIESFETRWAEFLVKYEMENHEWLRSLYSEREKWVPVYLHHTFWAGMISTQRSEGMHAYFDEFIHSRSTLKQFMENYDMAMGSKVRKEFFADFQCRNKVVNLTSTFRWERQFQEQYTNSIFKLVQDEIVRMIYCHIVPQTEEEEVASLIDIGIIEKFSVLERSIINWYHKEYTYTVEWRPIGEYIKCNCRKFEFKGILCCHIMKVLAQENIRKVHERYVLDRWKKTVQRAHSSIFFAGGYPHMTDEYKKFREVEKSFQQCTDIAMGNLQKMNYIKEICTAMKDDLVNWDNTDETDEENEDTGENDEEEEQQPILDPYIESSRGRARENRYRSAAEIVGRRRGSTRGIGNGTTRGTGRGTRGTGRGTTGGTGRGTGRGRGRGSGRGRGVDA